MTRDEETNERNACDEWFHEQPNKGASIQDAWVERARRAKAWISVKDQLPTEGQPVMFVVESKYPDYNGRVLGGSFCMIGTMPSFNTPGVGYSASHWMPLPAAPDQSGDKEEGK